MMAKVKDNEKNNLLATEYNTLLQLNIDYMKSQLLLKSLLITIVAGSTLFLLNNESTYILSFISISLDLLSVIIALSLLLVTGLLGLLHREFEHYKRVNIAIINEIEWKYLINTPIGIRRQAEPFQLQQMAYYIDSKMKRGKIFLPKTDFLGYAFYWLVSFFILVAAIVDIILYNSAL